MNNIPLKSVSLALLLVCASCQTGTDVQSGRQALLLDRNEEALDRFEATAQRDPNFFYRSGPFHENIWTYIGRSQYSTGRLPEARASLERALSLDKDDYLAHIYLGLTLARTGQRGAGLKEIETGMRGLHDWLDYLTYNTRFGLYWDPKREIREQIEKDLDAVSSNDVDWPELIGDAEWLGKTTEQEVDIARRNEQYEQRLRDRFPGAGVHAGFGF